MRLSALLDVLEEYQLEYNGKDFERDITGVCADSRECVSGSVFCCLKGSCIDGHHYAKQAVQLGAFAIITQRVLDVSVPQIIVKNTRRAFALLTSAFYGSAVERLKIIGVTGTNGKTTVTHMLASILEKAGKKVGVIGTLGIYYNGNRYDSPLTTPDPIALYKTFAKMFLHGIEYVVMEVSAHALWYEKTAAIPFMACIFTNLTHDHLDFFHNLDEYGETKAKLFVSCPMAILNGDDAFGREIGRRRADGEEKQKTIFYGLHTPADAFAIITDEGIKTTECMLNINDCLLRVSLRTIGQYNVYNALSAASCALALGLPTAAVADGLNAFSGVSGRLQRVDVFEGAHVFVDYAHTPDGLKQSLTTLKAHCQGRLICLFGCGGNRDKSKRPIMGEIAAKYSDFSVLTSDNPRYEDALDILADIEVGYRRFSKKYVVISKREAAIEYAVEMLTRGDILLVAGKGAETYQEIMGIKYPFNDYDILKKYAKKNDITDQS